MKIGKGVEWAAHTCALLGVLPPRALLPGEALAEFIGVPFPYLAKQLQALSRAGLVTTKRGAAGGYRLAKSPDEISLWDVTAAVEGTAPSFRCTEIRRQGPCGAKPAECSSPCFIAASFARAESGYRETLASVKLTSVISGISEDSPSKRKQQINDWIESHASISA